MKIVRGQQSFAQLLLSATLAINRQGEMKRATLLGATVHPNLAIVGLDDFTAEGKPQAIAIGLFIPLEPEMSFKNGFLFGIGDAGAGVGNGDLDFLGGAVEGADADLALGGGVLNGVVQQIDNHLAD